MITEKIYLYEDREDVFLTTYLWEQSSELPAGDQRPLVLICPGGAYMMCSDREAEPIALRFAAMGYHAAVLRYSNYGESRNDFSKLETDDPVKPQTLYPAQIRELGKAVLLLRERASEWHIDCDRIALCGFSAGAHNCAMYAVSWNRPILCDALKADPSVLRPAAVILGYPVVDLAVLAEVDAETRKMYGDMSLAFLGTREPSEAQLAEVNPARHVSAHTPPMFIWATAQDSTISVLNSLNLGTALSKMNVPFEMHIFEKGAHGLGLGDQASAMVAGQIDENVAGWPVLAEKWLAKRLALDIPVEA